MELKEDHWLCLGFVCRLHGCLGDISYQEVRDWLGGCLFRRISTLGSGKASGRQRDTYLALVGHSIRCYLAHRIVQRKGASQRGGYSVSFLWVGPPCLARDCRTHFIDPVALFLLFLCFRYVYLFVVLLVSRGRYPLRIFFLLLLCTNPVLGIRLPMFSKSDDGYDNH